MKEVELKLISELMKDARRSDRDLAKSVGVSQPTVSRIRARLEKAGFVREYVMIPDFYRLGYEILAVTFVKLKGILTSEEVERVREFTHDRMEQTPYDLIMLEKGTGLGYDGIIISFHGNYSSYTAFRNFLRQYDFLENTIDSFLIDLTDKKQYMPLTLSVLARHLHSGIKKKEK
jgi:DNA-binding Lrp family transcriptional regulator